MPEKKKIPAKKNKADKNDVMEDILGCPGDEFAAGVKELDCLIYKNVPNLKNNLPETKEGGRTWESSKENVSVKVWEDKAKIKVKVSPGNKKQISMKRIADIAMNAILEELKKEG
jgi:hypothetical protein